MTFAAKVASVRAGLMQQGWVPCSGHGCDKLVAPADGETGPVYCAICERKVNRKEHRQHG